MRFYKFLAQHDQIYDMVEFFFIAVTIAAGIIIPLYVVKCVAGNWEVGFQGGIMIGTMLLLPLVMWLNEGLKAVEEKVKKTEE